MPHASQPALSETLKKVPLFADLSEPELSYLADHAVPRHYKPGELVFAEGDACAGLYVVESGSVKIFKSSVGGREQILAMETPGHTVAELPVFDGGKYPASVAAVNPTTLLFVSKQDFYSLCLEHPKVALKVLRAVGRRLRALVGIIEELSFTTVRHRLVALLLRFAHEGRQSGPAVEFTLPASNQELAAQIGTVRELVSRNLSRLQAEGLIRMEGRTVTVLNVKNLQAILDETE